MSNLLVEHALANVWCAPGQNRSYVFRLPRLTPAQGARGSFRHDWTELALPSVQERYHVYYIGTIPGPELGFHLTQAGQWQSLLDYNASATPIQTLACLYNEVGRQHPACKAWVQVTPQGALYVAVQPLRVTGIGYESEALYLRFYRNLFLNSVTYPYADVARQLRCVSRVIESSADAQRVLDALAALQALPGQCWIVRNGVKVRSVLLGDLTPGTAVDLYQDAAVYKVVDFRLSQLYTFTSTLDAKTKYLLHYAGGLGEVIDFADDIDVFVLHATSGEGLYYHRNSADALRMLTHRDYSVPTAYLTQFKNALGATQAKDVVLRLHIRRSGFERPLVLEASRVHELYKLSDARVLQALCSVDATLHPWQAATLEASAYPQLMRERRAEDVTLAQVVQTYGYHGCAKLLGESLSPAVQDGTRWLCAVPPLYQVSAMALEYDAQGQLLGYYRHSQGTQYTCQHPQARQVEWLYGLGGWRLEQSSAASVTVAENCSWRAYAQDEQGWHDRTDSADYSVTGRTVAWNDASSAHWVRTDRQFLLYSLTLLPDEGVYHFSLNEERYVGNRWQRLPLQVPLGDLKVFLNGRGLVPGLDYVVQFPEVMLLNKSYLVPGAQQQVVVCYSGFCNPDLSLRAPVEWGFVRSGKLSANQQFDIRDTRVLRTQVGGVVQPGAALRYEEDAQAWRTTDARNGQPYVIEERLLPLQPYTAQDSLTLYQAARATDTQVSQYLSRYIEPNPAPSLSAIAQRHRLYSPFVARLIWALQHAEISAADVAAVQDAAQVRAACAPFLDWYRRDALWDLSRVPEALVLIEPHAWDANATPSLTPAQYAFLAAAVRLYGQGRINLAGQVQVAT